MKVQENQLSHFPLLWLDARSEDAMRPNLIAPDSIDSLDIRLWPDPVIDAVGQPVTSSYVETYYLAILGPSATWLLRHLGSMLELHPEGFPLNLSQGARRLGIGDRGGRNSPFVKTVARLVRFSLANLEDEHTLAVRRRVPPLTRAQVARLPEPLQRAHADWQQNQLRVPTAEDQRRRARQLALSYLEAGLGHDDTERQLMRLGIHPALCSEAARWAADRHHVAAVAAVAAATP
jgi:hypothetical protein